MLGRNGDGKTITMRAIMGMLAQRKGRLLYEAELIRLKSNGIARKGIGLLPRERGIFSSLNVEETDADRRNSTRAGFFDREHYKPVSHLAGEIDQPGRTKLSGGEQQMLAIARICATGASSCCWTRRRRYCTRSLRQIGNTIRVLRQQGFTIFLVERNFRFGSTVAERHYVVEHGR